MAPSREGLTRSSAKWRILAEVVSLVRESRRFAFRFRRRLIPLVLLAAMLCACWPAGCCQTATPCSCPDPREEGKAATRAYLAKNRPRYQRAIQGARAWLDGLTVDPLQLRAAGLKGKKKLTELVDAYARLHDVAPEDEKRRIIERVEEVTKVTCTPAYHDMLTINDRHFKQDATSYLRTALLMERLGLDTELYRAEIARVHKRLNDHMDKRGSHQKMVFHWYYSHFGLEEPFDLAAGIKEGVIAHRLSPYDYESNLRVYQLTHEIFVPYEYGEKLDADYFSKEELAYLRHALDRLTVHYIMKADPDINAELVSCLRFVRMTDSAVYREGLEFLLGSQKADGKWGDYQRYRRRFGDLVDQGWHLHTTLVAIAALITAFDFPE